ncbi:hypothetical protein U1Q18_036776 [Sarracenia purpurea var. burkii]
MRNLFVEDVVVDVKQVPNRNHETKLQRTNQILRFCDFVPVFRKTGTEAAALTSKPFDIRFETNNEPEMDLLSKHGEGENGYKDLKGEISDDFTEKESGGRVRLGFGFRLWNLADLEKGVDGERTKA